MEKMVLKGKFNVFRKGDEMYLEGIFDSGVDVVEISERPYIFVSKNMLPLVKSSEFVYDYEDGFILKDRNFNEIEMYKVYFFDTKNISDFRKEVEVKGGIHGEADIPFWRRLTLDKVVGFDYSNDNVLYVDIEVDDSRGFPKEYGEYEILCIGAYSSKGDEYYFDKFNYSEDEMLIEFVNLMREKGYTIISGWNILFDYKHILGRLKYYRLWDEFKYFSLCDYFDLYEQYKNTVKGLTTYTLEEISKIEGFETPKSRNKLVSLMNEEELRKYNLYDVWLCKEIDKKYGFSNVEMAVCNFVHLPITEKSPLRVGDFLVLNRLRELGNYVGFSGSDEKESKEFEGALVLEPVPGVHRNVAYIDINSLYPNVIIYKNIDIDGWKGEVYPYIMRMLLDKRAEAKRMYKETGLEEYNISQQVYKIMANASYGLFGLRYFRYYNPEKAGQVTGGGREVLMKMKSFIEGEFGARVVYGDSVSASSKVVFFDVNGMEYGEVCIEELFERYKDRMYVRFDGKEVIEFDDKDEIYVLSYNCDCRVVDISRLKRIIRHRVSNDMFKVKFEGGEIELTGWHSLMVLRGNEILEVKPIDIEKGDKLILFEYDLSKFEFDRDFSDVESCLKYSFMLNMIRFGSCISVKFVDVLSVEKIEYDGYVYDLEVPGTNTFVANRVLVHNTDSEFVSLSDVLGQCESVPKDVLIEIANVLVDLVNEVINPFQVKLESVFKKILFMRDEEGRGIKKRYIAMDYEGKYYYRGIELRRSDYCELAKEVMSNVIDWIMKDELKVSEIERRLRVYKIRMYKGIYDEKLIIAKSITKSPEEYSVIPPHIRAYMIAKELGYEFTDYRVKYVFIKKRKFNGVEVNVWPIFSKDDLKKVKIDYEHYWNVQIYPPCKRLMSALEDDRVKKLDDWF